MRKRSYSGKKGSLRKVVDRLPKVCGLLNADRCATLLELLLRPEAVDAADGRDSCALRRFHIRVRVADIEAVRRGLSDVGEGIIDDAGVWLQRMRTVIA